MLSVMSSAVDAQDSMFLGNSDGDSLAKPTRGSTNANVTKVQLHNYDVD